MLPHTSITHQLTVPTAITFNWTSCKNIPRGMNVIGQPVAINRKLYMRGLSNWTETVLVYTPDQKSWTELPPPPMYQINVATLRGRLLVVGGWDKSTEKKTDAIFTFDEQWFQSLPPMPKALTSPTVVGYHDHLIVIGGCDSNHMDVADVNILSTTSNKWITAEPLPSVDVYRTCLIEDTLYLVGQTTNKAFRTHVPSLISRARSGVWESIARLPFDWSSPIAVGNSLLIVGGSDDVDPELESIATSSIHLYDPTKDQWTQCGDLPEEMMRCCCIELSGKLYVLDGETECSISLRSVYTSIPSFTH